ncbi:fumarylacetoacetate hydrolase family protein [Cohnella thailandensis]|uniref:Fumarylacetoacetate hydrolase family protein n=1 Tax=Cohnella thailandensis TaxID=557557 RepID=A0A841SXQ2_9BACL|nr:fumarylacetoacetate hydrolase family protein [Cohnella thailandensis]MBB6634958.1 fumarylacetoacetate hydrolase family protein [Cohnella thailandensis]MBP1975820.1 2-keto-4-pentenoate hydratase/2-oxohepta-3-ene-1,7-dioic acid hydratase in catechol pathway [Cohnella thailandensis]
MKLLQYKHGEEVRLAVRTAKGIASVEAMSEVAGLEAGSVPTTMREALDGGAAALAALRKLVGETEGRAETLDEASLVYAPCVSDPQKIICVGLNYRKHAEETNAPIPEYPILFNKFANALAAEGEDVPLPVAVTDKVDYEAELAIVIGKRAKNVSREEALDYVFGYCNANDLSARDLQMRTAQWMLGKTCDGFAPIGPFVATADEIPNPNALAISCTVNGEVRQSSSTSDMIFPCDEVISYISRHMTLEPGDLILTGTPEGVVLGYPPEKQVYLKDGDTVTIEIEGLGKLTNVMRADG